MDNQGFVGFGYYNVVIEENRVARSFNLSYRCFHWGVNFLRVLKGIVHQFWIYNICFVALPKKHFLWKVHLAKTTLTRNNWEKRVHKVTPTEDYYIYYIYNTDWLCAPFFLNYFESEWFYRDEPFIKYVSFGWARKKCYIFKIGEQSL